jgi:hypothetical protein
MSVRSMRGLGDLYQSRDPGAYSGTYEATGDPIGGEESPPDEWIYGDMTDSESGSDYSLIGASLANDLENAAIDNYFGDEDPIVLGEGYQNDSPETHGNAAYHYGYEKGRIDAVSGYPSNADAASGAVEDPAYRPAFVAGYTDGYAAGKSGSTLPTSPKVAPLPLPVPGPGPAPAPGGMSTGTKVAIGLGAAAAAAAAYVAWKKRKRS